jgi:hypothetical protein
MSHPEPPSATLESEFAALLRDLEEINDVLDDWEERARGVAQKDVSPLAAQLQELAEAILEAGALTEQTSAIDTLSITLSHEIEEAATEISSAGAHLEDSVQSVLHQVDEVVHNLINTIRGEIEHQLIDKAHSATQCISDRLAHELDDILQRFAKELGALFEKTVGHLADQLSAEIKLLLDDFKQRVSKVGSETGEAGQETQASTELVQPLVDLIEGEIDRLKALAGGLDVG